MREFDIRKMKAASMVLRALKHPLRLKMLQIMDEQPGIIVTDIYVKLRIEQSVASQHLKVLRHAGIVRTQRAGKAIRYYVNDENLKAIEPLANQLAVFFDSTKTENSAGEKE